MIKTEQDAARSKHIPVDGSLKISVKTFEDAAQVELEDARSRVSIWAINHAEDELYKIIMNPAFCSVTPYPAQTAMRNPVLANYGPYDYSGGSSFDQRTILAGFFQNTQNMANRPLQNTNNFIQVLQNVNPPEVCTLISGRCGPQVDYCYLSHSLGLDKLDYDCVSGRLSRFFGEYAAASTDNITYFKICDKNGNVKEIKALKGGQVYSVKTFFHQALQQTYPFFFKQEKPSLYFPIPEYPAKGTKIILTLDFTTAQQNKTAIAWIQPCGNLDDLDWDSLKEYRIELLWRDFECTDSGRSDDFAKILAIVAAGKKHNVKIKVIKAVGVQKNLYNGTYPDFCEVKPLSLSMANLLWEAKRRHILIDPILQKDPLDLDFIMESMIHQKQQKKVMVSWGFRSTVKKKTFEFMLEDLNLNMGRIASPTREFTQQNVLVIVPETKDVKDQIDKLESLQIPCCSCLIMRDQRILKRYLWENEIDCVFVMDAQSIKSSEISSTVTLCKRLNIKIIGYFKERIKLNKHQKEVFPLWFSPEAIIDAQNAYLKEENMKYLSTVAPPPDVPIQPLE